MNIIALRGIGGSGKSTTIRLLHNTLLQNNYELVSHPINNTGDFSAIFTKNGKIIGITSSGDTYDKVKSKLDALINAQCIYCVCVCRTFDRAGHGTNAAIDSFTNFEKEYIEKTFENVVDQQSVVNQNDAQVIFNRLQELV